MGVSQPKPMHGFTPDFQEILTPNRYTAFCVQQVASDRYYGFYMGMPSLLQCVEFLLSPLQSKRYYRLSFQICKICSSLQKPPWVDVWSHFKNKMATTGISLMVIKEFYTF